MTPCMLWVLRHQPQVQPLCLALQAGQADFGILFPGKISQHQPPLLPAQGIMVREVFPYQKAEVFDQVLLSLLGIMPEGTIDLKPPPGLLLRWLSGD